MTTEKIRAQVQAGIDARTLDPEELEMSGHPDPAGQEFFWPTVSRVYRSRSGARGRLSIFESYGARGRLVRTTPQWAPAETKDQKIARLEARLAELGDPQ